jgi:predicted transglutaminase-like cysteine proteinase
MFRSRFLLGACRPSLLLGLTVATLAPVEASAMNLIPDLAPALSGTSCGFTGPASAPAPAGFELTASTSKASAILGGQPSALEMIRLAQETEQASLVTPSEALAVGQSEEIALSPAIGGVRPEALACRIATVEPQIADSNPENFLASKRLRIGHTSFDRDWRRVSDDRISERRFHRLVGGTSGDTMATLDSVNRWVNGAIAYADDQALFGRRDYWAGARRTLTLGRGDCEDIALTKLELLAAAGVPRENMILTIARDLVRNADHAVLIVRHDGRYYMLDNASDEVFDASTSHDYRPVLSFGTSQTWLHGY